MSTAVPGHSSSPFGVSNPFKAGLFLCPGVACLDHRRLRGFKPLQSGAFFVSIAARATAGSGKNCFKPLQSGAFFVSIALTMFRADVVWLVSNPFKAGLFLCHAAAQTTAAAFTTFQTPSKRGFFCVAIAHILRNATEEVSNPFKAGLFLCLMQNSGGQIKLLVSNPFKAGLFLCRRVPASMAHPWLMFQTPSKRGFFCVKIDFVRTLMLHIVSNPFKAGLFLCQSSGSSGSYMFRSVSNPFKAGLFLCQQGRSWQGQGATGFKPLQSGAFFVSTITAPTAAAAATFQTPSKRGFFCVPSS